MYKKVSILAFLKKTFSPFIRMGVEKLELSMALDKINFPAESAGAGPM